MDHLPDLTGSLPVPAACADVRRRLDAFVDGELLGEYDAVPDHSVGRDRARSVDAVARHLASCARCARLAQQLRAQRTRLLALGRTEAIHPETRASEALRARVARLLAG